MRVGVYVPSFGRAGKVTTHNFFPSCRIVVPESQVDSYREHHGDAVVGIPDSRDGSVPRKRNAVLDVAEEDGVLMVDDDMKRIVRLPDKKPVPPEEIHRLMLDGFSLCRDLGAKLWGIGWDENPVHYNPGVPFSLNKFFYGMWGVIKSGAKYDERLTRGEDVDFWLQHIRRDRITLRVNRYVAEYRMREVGQKGGISVKHDPKEDTDYLTRKWGSGLVKVKEDGSLGLPKSPIPGV